jgi:hypothetical protein
VLNKFNQVQERKKSLDDTYRKLNKITQSTDLSYIAIKLIAQHLPAEAWISQLTMGGAAGAASSSRAPMKPFEPDAPKEITIIGYLEDDNPANLENLKTFVDKLNQPNGYLPIEAALKRLEVPKTVIPRGKNEFEITIRIKETEGALLNHR